MAFAAIVPLVGGRIPFSCNAADRVDVGQVRSQSPLPVFDRTTNLVMVLLVWTNFLLVFNNLHFGDRSAESSFVAAIEAI